VPPGYTPTTVNAPGSNAGNDSNGLPATVILAEGEANLTIDFGYKAPCSGSVGNYVWNDANGNGIQDVLELPLGNVTLNLRNAMDNSVLQTTTTAAGTGIYGFGGLCPGSYKVEVITPTGFVPTIANAPGSNAGNDSNPNLFVVTLPLDNSSDLTIDFGFVALGSIGDRVWNDTNGNGIQDSGEPGLTGWTATISGANLPTGYTTTQTTGTNGIYTFSDLPAGTYTVCITPMTGFAQTYDLDGLATANCATRTITAGENATDVDFGYRPNASIGDRVWNDTNGNGIQDSGEPGLTGWTATISGANLPSGYTTTQTTGANGIYTFSNLPAGTYTVCITPMTSYTQTYDLDGLATANCASRTITAGENATDVDFGYRLNGSIGDRVWNDTNGNGIQDSGEPGLTGWTATISGANLPTGYTTTQTTGANGIYTFSNLPAGTYTVCITPMMGFAQTYDLDGLATANCATRTITAGENATDVDFGYRPNGSIGDRVWNDTNGNGIQDSGEPGLTGWTATISGANLPTGYTTTQTTGANGIYTFSNLPAGTYTVCITPMTGFAQTYDLDGLATANCATPARIGPTWTSVTGSRSARLVIVCGTTWMPTASRRRPANPV